MQSVFDVKNELPFGENLFGQMRKNAVQMLQNTEKNKYTQAIVMLSSKGNEYGAIIKNALSEDKADEKALLERLKDFEDTEVRYVLCMWQDMCVDIPSFAFRDMLCAANPQNAEAAIFVMTKNGVSAIKTANTMK